jgi:hypothetical protein
MTSISTSGLTARIRKSIESIPGRAGRCCARGRHHREGGPARPAKPHP